MNRQFVVRLGLIPALVITLLTILRARLEVTQPDAVTTRLVSTMVLGPGWVLISAVLFLRAGASFGLLRRQDGTRSAIDFAGSSVGAQHPMFPLIGPRPARDPRWILRSAGQPGW